MKFFSNASLCFSVAAVAGLMSSRAQHVDPHDQSVFLQNDVSYLNPLYTDSHSKNTSTESWLFDPDWFILESSLYPEDVDIYVDGDASSLSITQTKDSVILQFLSAEGFDFKGETDLYDPSWLLVEDIGADKVSYFDGSG